MKKFSAQYIFTNAGPPLKRGIITAGDDGVILNVEDTGGDLKEQSSVEFHNGIIIPGFVNCHAHLELSHLKGRIPCGTGLSGFIGAIRELRDNDPAMIFSSISAAEDEMLGEGVVLCADICNTPATFFLKSAGRIKYVSLLEVFGIDPARAAKRMEELSVLAKSADEAGLVWWPVPHSAYSVSLTLFRLLREKSKKNKVTSIHFMESAGEKSFLSGHGGPVMDSYVESGLAPLFFETVTTHTAAILEEVTPSGNLILVHNTHADADTVRTVNRRKNLYWCLCPNSNLYIENKIPPLDILLAEGCTLVTGTDSSASNRRLSILEELKTLQNRFPDIPLEEMIRWATINGARALGEETLYGKIAPGKKPGLLLIRETDLFTLKLLPESSIKRLL